MSKRPATVPNPERRAIAPTSPALLARCGCPLTTVRLRVHDDDSRCRPERFSHTESRRHDHHHCQACEEEWITVLEHHDERRSARKQKENQR